MGERVSKIKMNDLNLGKLKKSELRITQVWELGKPTPALSKGTSNKFSCAGPEIFLRFELDLNFSRPGFSEIKVQNKWLCVNTIEFLQFFSIVFF